MLITSTFIVLFLYLLYKLSIKNYKYWEERNVPYVKPAPLVGNFWKILSFQKQIGHYLAELYNQFDTPYFGIFIFSKPLLVVRCPELIKNILVKDFQNFNDRTIVSNEKCDPMGSKFLFFLRNPEWKYVRTGIAPAFSTGKLKNMVPLMNVAAEEMKAYLEKHSHKDSIEMKEVSAKYATDVIASCAFGIEANCFKSEDAEFRKVGELAFSFNLKIAMYQMLCFVCPGIVEFFRLPFFDPVFIDFIRKVFRETFNSRKATNYKRHDLIDTLIHIKETVKDRGNFKFDREIMVAQAGQFFAAGSDTISSTISFALYELCIQPDIQERAREEIQYSLRKHGKFSYETLQDMPYLNMIIFEALRKYPVLPFLDRSAHEDYKVPHMDFIIEKGTAVYIPVFGLHYDPKYFTDPQKFDPERFSNDNKSSFPEFAFIPFGKGPRSCIGERFGFVAAKLGLAHILSGYELEMNTETPVPLEYMTKGFVLASKVGSPMKLRKIRK